MAEVLKNKKGSARQLPFCFIRAILSFGSLSAYL